MFHRQHHLACGCYCTGALSLLFLDADTWHTRVLSSSKVQMKSAFLLTAAYFFIPKVPSWSLWTEYKHLYWLCLSVSLFPSSSADESDGSVNYMQPGDWLQRFRGKYGFSSPESLFHMNYYTLCFVLNMHCVPYGTLKVIWQHFGAKQQYTQCCSQSEHLGKSTHTNMHIKAECTKIHMCLHMCKECNHAHTHFSPPLCSLLLIHPALLFSEYKSAAKFPRPKQGNLKRIRNEKKELLNVSLSTYDEHFGSESGEPAAWKIHLSVRQHSSTIRGRAASSASTLGAWIFNASFG